jgi:hypothetical protein
MTLSGNMGETIAQLNGDLDGSRRHTIEYTGGYTRRNTVPPCRPHLGAARAAALGVEDLRGIVAPPYLAARWGS